MAKASDERQAAIDRLYGLPLDEFTPARDDLARDLRREGEREEAEAVRKLRKPSVSAWALNQVRRNDPEQVDELIVAGERLQEGQEQLLSGGGREAFDRAAADERRLVAELARHAERELVASGRSVSGSLREKVRATLHAAASDPEARAGLAAGRLVHEHEVSGLGPLAVAPSPSTPKRKEDRSPKEDAALKRKARALENRLEGSRARRQELDETHAAALDRLRQARREAARIASELERAEASEEEARTNADDAAAAVEGLEQELRELRANG